MLEIEEVNQVVKKCKYWQADDCSKADKRVNIVTCVKKCPVPEDPCEHLTVKEVKVITGLAEEVKVLVDVSCAKEPRTLKEAEIPTCTKSRYLEDCIKKK